MVPPGGFHFVERHDGIEIKIESTSVEAVAAALLQYRVNNGLPPGDTLSEVRAYICTTWPHFCREDGTDPQRPKIPGQTQPLRAPLSRRMVVWMTSLWNLGANNFVTAEIAEARAKVCAACPQNVDFKIGGCSGCVDSMERLGFTWKRNRTTSLDKELKGCRASARYLPCAVLANKLPPLTEEENAALDEKCWRKA